MSYVLHNNKKNKNKIKYVCYKIFVVIMFLINFYNFVQIITELAVSHIKCQWNRNLRFRDQVTINFSCDIVNYNYSGFNINGI